MKSRIALSRMLPLIAALTLLLATAIPAAADKIDRTFDFELGKWYELEVTDGPVTIHRVRVVETARNVKSRIIRPHNPDFTKTVVIEVEYTNDSTRDIDMNTYVVWKDARGNVIDGYDDEEELDDEERHDITTMTQSTLIYGLEQAKSLEVRLDW